MVPILFFLRDMVPILYSYAKRKNKINLEVLAQLANAEIARPDVVIWVRTRDLTVVCEF